MNTTIVRKPAVTTSLTKQPKPQTTDHYHFGVLQTNRTTVVFYFRIWNAGTIDVTFDSGNDAVFECLKHVARMLGNGMMKFESQEPLPDMYGISKNTNANVVESALSCF